MIRDRKKREAEVGHQPWRHWLVFALLTLGGVALLARAVYLQVIDQDFLERQGDARILRVTKLSANRGMILDRNGEPLAVSTPVDTVWADPRKLAEVPQEFPKLAKALDRDPQWLARRVTSSLDREFVYLARHMPPSEAVKVKALGIPGVDTLREYRRYYPAGEVTGHLLGFTNVDDVGQEGLELAYDQWLGGEPGAKRVMRDSLGRTIEDIERIKEARPGQDLRTSIDLRVQYLAYRELKSALQENRARLGLGRGDRHRDRRSAGDGQPAGVQPERPRAIPAFPLSQSRDQRLLRARLEHQAVHRRRRDGDRPLSRRHADRHLAGHDARRHQDGEGPQQPRHDRRDDGAREVEQRRRREDRADAQARADVARARPVRLRARHGFRIPRRVRRASSPATSTGARSARRRWRTATACR